MNCENCGNEHDGSYGSGRFCSSKCARGFSTKRKRSLINEKIKIYFHENLEKTGKVGCIIDKKLPKKFCVECGNPISKRNKSGFCKKHLYSSKYFRNKISKSCKGKAGGYRKGSGRSNGGYYKNQYFDSSFEIEIAKFLELHKINWKRNTNRIYYKWKNKKTYYIPDFIIDDNLYLEAKGFWYKDKKEKTLEAIKQNNLKWILLMQKEEWEIDKNILLKKIYNYKG